MATDPSYQAKVHHDQGGDTLTVESGGMIDILSGGTLQNAGTVSHTGTQSFDDIIGNDTSLDILGKAAAAGAVGGAVNPTGSSGGAGATTTAGGVGGAAAVAAGAGGAKTDTGNAAGGAGGAASAVGGVGGATASSGSDNGGAGGGNTVTAGAGGAASAGSGDGGAGGDVDLTAGAGGTSSGGAAGAPGSVNVAAGVFKMGVQTILMNNATVVLTLVPGTPAGVLMTGNFLKVDPEGGTEILKLPPEADCAGVALFITNIGGETITLQDDGGGALLTIATAKHATAFCDGTTWEGLVEA